MRAGGASGPSPFPALVSATADGSIYTLTFAAPVTYQGFSGRIGALLGSDSNNYSIDSGGGEANAMQVFVLDPPVPYGITLTGSLAADAFRNADGTPNGEMTFAVTNETSPLAAFGSPVGLWDVARLRSGGYLFQDAAETIVATTHLDPVAVAYDPTTGQRLTAAVGEEPLLFDETVFDAGAVGKWSFQATGSQWFSFPDSLFAGTDSEQYMALRLVYTDPATFQGGLHAIADANIPNSHYVYAGDVYETFGTTARQSFTPSLSVGAYRTYEVGNSGGAWEAVLDGVSQSSSTQSVPNQRTGATILGATDPFFYWVGRASALMFAKHVPTGVYLTAARNYLGTL